MSPWSIHISLSAILFLSVARPGFSYAQSTSTEENTSHTDDRQTNGFNRLLEQRSLGTTKAVRDYLLADRDAADFDQAGLWLLNHVRTHGHELHVAAMVESFLDDSTINSKLRKAAAHTHCLALAKRGEIDHAVDAFQQLLKTIQIREPDSIVALARSLATQAQMAGEYKAANQIFEELSTAFFLNGFVRDLCKRQITKFEMLGKQVPNLTGRTVGKQTVDVKSLKGKVVLIDFWATNCPPCVEEFPRMRSTYRRMKPEGFEIIGISLDERSTTVTAFQQKRQALPWPLIMNTEFDPRATTRFGVKKIPALFLVDRSGRIAAVDARGVDLEPTIVELLRKPAQKTEGSSE